MRPGTRIAGRYELLELLGRGGMGEVHRAHDHQLDRTVALKLLPGHVAGDPNAVERFRREARAAAALSHPNVVAVHDFLEADGMHVLVMEHVAGATLADLLRDRGALPVEQGVHLLAGIAAGLQAAHDAGLVHRDVKAANVLIGPGGIPKVTDFGIARSTRADATTTMTIRGSLSTLAPEQAQGRAVDRRADVYALGCLAVEVLTGAPTFDGDTPVVVVHKHVHEPPPDVRSRRPEVPAHVAAAIAAALAKDPEARTPTAAAFASALLGTPAAGADPTVALAAPAGADPTLVLPAASPGVPMASDPDAPTVAWSGDTPDGADTEDGRSAGGIGSGVVTAVRRRPLLAGVGLATLLLVLAVAARTLGASTDPTEPSVATGPDTTAPTATQDPSADPTPEPTPTDEPTPEPDPEPDPEPAPEPAPEPTTVEDGIRAVIAAIQDANAAGGMTAAGVQELDEVLVELVESLRDDKVNDARKRADELLKVLDELVDDGEATPEAAARVSSRVDDLRRLLEELRQRRRGNGGG